MPFGRAARRVVAVILLFLHPRRFVGRERRGRSDGGVHGGLRASRHHFCGLVGAVALGAKVGGHVAVVVVADNAVVGVGLEESAANRAEQVFSAEQARLDQLRTRRS